MELFLQNCEVAALEVRVERPGAPPESRRLARPFALIGRDARNDVRLDDGEVSRRHAYLQAVAGRVYCVDLDSRTGVHWPDGPRASGWLGWDEPLRIGGALLRVSRPRTTALVLKEESAPPAPPEVVFEVTGPSIAPLRCRLHDPLVLVGGASACKVRLRHGAVSRHHCALVLGRLGVWMVDLLSREGTCVNGRGAPWARLAVGDSLEVGPFVLHLRPTPPREDRGLSIPPSALGRPAFSGPPSALTPADASLLMPVVNEMNRMQQQMLDQFHQTMVMMAEMFTTLHREQAGLVREELEHLRQVTRELHALQAERALALASAPARVPAAAAGKEARAPAAAAGDFRPPPAVERDAAEKPVERPAATAPSKSPAEVHDWLTRRIDALQAERQGRWQKLLQMVIGR